MLAITRLAVLATALFSAAALPASADPQKCEPLVPLALEAVQTVIKDGATATVQVPLVDGYVKDCPDHGWITLLGGELDLMVFKGLRNANGGQPTQDGVSYLARALLRSDVFHNAGASTSGNRYNVATRHSYYNTLDYNIAATSRRAIIDELATLAVRGVVHPYLTGTVPLECKGWLTSDVQTVSYKIDTAEEKVLLPFVEAGAEACRTATTQSDRFPLALKAKAYMKLIEKGIVSDRAEVERMLIAAEGDVKVFLGPEGYRSLLFGEEDANQLKKLIRKHGVHTGEGPATIDRSLWFTKEYIGTEVGVRSLAGSFGDYWTPLASGDTDAPAEEVARARNRFSGYIIELRKQGAEAGLPDETSKMLAETLTAFQKGDIGPPETMNQKPIPPWLLTILINLTKPPEPAPAE